MYNNSEHKGHHYHHDYNHNHHHNFAPVSPRISFSNDFADSKQAIKQETRSSRSEAPVSSDFEFSVSTNYSMSGADELFFKGRLLPFKETTASSLSSQRTTTLRDELLLDDDDGDVALQPPKARWKSLLGLKKAHIGSNSKKAEKGSDGSSGYIERRRFSGLVLHENEAHVSKTSSQVRKIVFFFSFFFFTLFIYFYKLPFGYLFWRLDFISTLFVLYFIRKFKFLRSNTNLS